MHFGKLRRRPARSSPLTARRPTVRTSGADLTARKSLLRSASIIAQSRRDLRDRVSRGTATPGAESGFLASLGADMSMCSLDLPPMGVTLLEDHEVSWDDEEAAGGSGAPGQFVDDGASAVPGQADTNAWSDADEWVWEWGPVAVDGVFDENDASVCCTAPPMPLALLLKYGAEVMTGVTVTVGEELANGVARFVYYDPPSLSSIRPEWYAVT